MLGVFNVMLWDKLMLCYGVCFKRYVWIDCIYIDYVNNIEINVLNYRWWFFIVEFWDKLFFF